MGMDLKGQLFCDNYAIETKMLWHINFCCSTAFLGLFEQKFVVVLLFLVFLNRSFSSYFLLYFQ